MAEDRRFNPALEFLKTYWFLILFTIGAMGTLTTMWFRLEYVVAAVNPEAMVEYSIEQTIEHTKTEIYRCLNTLLWKGNIVPGDVLGCAE